jgi:hypothetical protein
MCKRCRFTHKLYINVLRTFIQFVISSAPLTHEWTLHMKNTKTFDSSMVFISFYACILFEIQSTVFILSGGWCYLNQIICLYTINIGSALFNSVFSNTIIFYSNICYVYYITQQWPFTSSDISSKMKNNIGLNTSFQEFIHVLMVPMKSQTE